MCISNNWYVGLVIYAYVILECMQPLKRVDTLIFYIELSAYLYVAELVLCQNLLKYMFTIQLYTRCILIAKNHREHLQLFKEIASHFLYEDSMPLANKQK